MGQGLVDRRPFGDQAAAGEQGLGAAEAQGADETAGVLETDVVDDAYFSALLGAAKAEARTSMDAAERTLARYKTVLPGGRHLQDAAQWPDRLRGASGG